jgi:hypothetical protein
MSGPPGSKNPNLPAKPNTKLPSFKPAFQQQATGRGYGSTNAPGQTSASATQFHPRSVASPVSQGWQQSYPATSSAPSAPQPEYSAPPQTGYGAYTYQQPYQQQQAYYSQPGYDAYAAQTAAAPQIANPFPLPGQGGGGKYGNNSSFDPEHEAQIAQWQSAYAPKEESTTNTKTFGKKEQLGNANTIPLGSRGASGPQLDRNELAAAATTDSRAAAVITGADGKQKTVVRSGGGKTWQDSSLLEWDPTHPRLFIGNLAGEVTDDALLKAFSKYASVSKARVVRDHRTTKSKGFGFVSFEKSDDYFQAAKEMQGKYIGSHPVLIKRSTTEIKAVKPPVKGKGGKHGKGNNRKNKDGHGGEAVHGSVTGAGVKKNAKTKNGLKLLA